MGETYGITGLELLLCCDDASAALCCVQSGFATDDSLALSTATGANLAADLGNGVPVVRHLCGLFLSLELFVGSRCG